MASDDTDAAIGAFCAHARTQLTRIGEISGVSARVFRKVLYMTLLDALARVAFPRLSSRDRFLALIRRFSDWPDGGRISVLHFARRFVADPNPDVEPLRLLARAKLKEWSAQTGVVPVSSDPTRAEVEKIWLHEEERARSIALDSLEHASLLASYNPLVSELRAPGHAVETQDVAVPHYHRVTHNRQASDDPLETIQLVYPFPFLLERCERTLVNLEVYLRRNQLNPYASHH